MKPSLNLKFWFFWNYFRIEFLFFVTNIFKLTQNCNLLRYISVKPFLKRPVLTSNTSSTIFLAYHPHPRNPSRRNCGGDCWRGCLIRIRPWFWLAITARPYKNNKKEQLLDGDSELVPPDRPVQSASSSPGVARGPCQRFWWARWWILVRNRSRWSPCQLSSSRGATSGPHLARLLLLPEKDKKT